MTPKTVLALLDELENLGFDDEIFWRLHHFRDSRPETIHGFRSYCEKTSVFSEGGNNELVCLRLAFVLKTYREWSLPHGQAAVFKALADAAYLGIPPKPVRQEG